MATLNIVTEPKNHAWILYKLAEELAKGFPGATVNGPPGDVNYFCNYALYDPRMLGVSVAYFTHEPEDSTAFYDVAARCDHAIAMNYKTFTQIAHLRLRNRKVEKSTIIIPGTDLKRMKPLVFGVAGRVYNDGRKGEKLVATMHKHDYSVLALGHGWPLPEHCFFQGTREEFYQAIDYYVVTASLEGGPMPVLDALAMGVPIIAPDVGFCDFMPRIRYETGSWSSLQCVLKNLTEPRTWDQWRAHHRVYFENWPVLKELA